MSYKTASNVAGLSVCRMCLLGMHAPSLPILLNKEIQQN